MATMTKKTSGAKAPTTRSGGPAATRKPAGKSGAMGLNKSGAKKRPTAK